MVKSFRQHTVPHQSRVPLALCDVRFVEEHSHRDRARRAPSPRRSSMRCALARRPHIKLYNSGSFFDPRAIPWPTIRRSRHCWTLRARHRREPSRADRRELSALPGLIAGRLEVAMGLETVHPTSSSPAQQAHDPRTIRRGGRAIESSAIDLRVFILVNRRFCPKPKPYTGPQRSLDFAFQCGARPRDLSSPREGATARSKRWHRR
jgi:hypothetical protein